MEKTHHLQTHRIFLPLIAAFSTLFAALTMTVFTPHAAFAQYPSSREPSSRLNDRERESTDTRSTPNTVNDPPRTGPLKNWLVVEIIERDTHGGKALKFADFLPVVIVDSATQTAMYARSGELVEIGADRTYYISIASTGERRFSIDGQPVQRLHAGIPVDDDLVFQREFYVVFENGPTPAPLAITPAPATRAEADENELARLRREMIAMRMELDDVKRQKLLRESVQQQPASRGEAMMTLPKTSSVRVLPDADDNYYSPSSDEGLTPAPVMRDVTRGGTREGLREAYSEELCAYRVQFCAVPIEREAERIRAALEQGGIGATTVEVFLDPRRNITFYRVRGGCFSSFSQARAALREYARLADRLRLGVQPMAIRN